MSVSWPHRHADVLNGLDALASEPPSLSEAERDPRWPDLTNAVHWVVDDTGWDQLSPTESIGLFVKDESEANAAAEVVALILSVSARQGPAAADAAWFQDPEWPEVRRASARAASLIRANDA